MYYDASDLTIAGNVGADPELRFTPNKGVAVTNLRVAKYNGENTDPTWFDITVFGDMAEHVVASISKGDRVTVVGRFERNDWKAQDGSTRTNLRIVADDIGLSLRWHPAVSQRPTVRATQEHPAVNLELAEAPF